MEPIISKLQEGVKYPRFERDATTIINDLVEHITKERGVYSSSIEPNPNEHNVWFNTDDNTLYIYNKGVWRAINNKNVTISKDGTFYPYPIINIVDRDVSDINYYADYNKHYVIIVDTDNIRKFLNNIVLSQGYDHGYIIIGDDTNINGTFLVNIYDTYIYYIKLSSSYIEEDNVFYCDNGHLYYNGNNGNISAGPLDITGFYTKEYLKYSMESYEGVPIEDMNLTSIFIEPEDDSTIIIGKQVFDCDVSILGVDLNNANIYMYNNILHIGNTGDSSVSSDNIYWYDTTVYCNSKHIGDIKITHSNSDLDLYITAINFIVGNNNTVTIDTTVCGAIDECNIYVINEVNNDKSRVILGNTFASGRIDEYVNLCGTKISRDNGNPIKCNTFVTTTLEDIDRPNDNTNPVDLSECNKLIIDTPYKYPTNTEYIRSLRSVKKIGVTDETLCNYLPSLGLNVVRATRKTNYFNDRVEICYMATDGGYPLYVKTVYKR